MTAIRVPGRLVIGVLAAAAAVVASAGSSARAATPEPALLTPSVLTAVHNAAGAVVTSVTVGTTVHPWAKVAGSSSTPTGGVSVYTWHNANCTGTWYSVYGGILTNGIIDATFLPYTSNDAGAVSYRVDYDGNGIYAAAAGLCASASIVKANPVVALAIHNPAHRVVTSVPYGTAVHGLVTVTGAVDTPTGTASISRFPSADCSGIGTTIGPSVLTAGVLHSGYQFTFPAPGTWSFRAHYFGDSTYNARTSSCITITVTKATPTFSTALHDASHAVPDYLLVGQEIHAAASLSSTAGTPTGTVTIRRYADGTCTAIEALPVIAAAPTMDPAGPAYTTPTPLIRSYRLVYSGDSLFNAVSGPCMAMQWRAMPAVSAALHDAGHHVVTTVHVGSPVHIDTTVTGGSGTPTGEVTFRVSTGSTCGAFQSFGTRSLSGGAVDDAGAAYTPSAAGTYSFRASYGGSPTYAPAISSCVVLTVTAVPQPTPAPTAPPKPGPTPTAQPTAHPTASAIPSAGASGEPATSSAPGASADASASASANASDSPAPGSSVTPAASSPDSSANPTPAAAATDSSGPGLWIVAIGLILLLIVAFLVRRWMARSRRGQAP